MTRTLSPAHHVGGIISVPGDKSIAHRAALLSVLAEGPVTIHNYPNNSDCACSLRAAEALGVRIDRAADGALSLIPADKPGCSADTLIDCGNSGTTARLTAGLLAGLAGQSAIITGDASLSARPMERVVGPLTAMGAELFDTDGHLPLRVRGQALLPFEYRLPVASAQVKSALLLAGLAAGCSVQIREDTITRDHTERMIAHLGGAIESREIKPLVQDDPLDPRKKVRFMPEDFKKEISLGSRSRLSGGEVHIPGDMSTAAFFLAAAAITGYTLTVTGVGLNPTRTGFVDYLKAIGCQVRIENATVVSGEPRGDVTVTGVDLKPRKISGDMTVALIYEIPVVAVIAACTPGKTVIRDAAELKYKESNRLDAIAVNLERMGVACGVLEDGLVIEGGSELSGADFLSFGDHRIAMAFSIAALVATGPSTIDNDEVVAVSCPAFYELLSRVTSA